MNFALVSKRLRLKGCHLLFINLYFEIMPFISSSFYKIGKLLIITGNISGSLGLNVDTKGMMDSSCLTFTVLSMFLSSAIAFFTPKLIT